MEIRRDVGGEAAGPLPAALMFSFPPFDTAEAPAFTAGRLGRGGGVDGAAAEGEGALGCAALPSSHTTFQLSFSRDISSATREPTSAGVGATRFNSTPLATRLRLRSTGAALSSAALLMVAVDEV